MRELCFIMKITDYPMDVFDPRYFKNVNTLPILYSDSTTFGSNGWKYDQFPILNILTHSETGDRTFDDNIRWLSGSISSSNLYLSTQYSSGVSIPSSTRGLGKFLNMLIIRGEDLTKPLFEIIGNNELIDRNNNMIYKVLDINSSMVLDSFNTKLKTGGHLNPALVTEYILEFCSLKENNMGFRFSNLNELLNFSEIETDISTFSSKTVPQFNARTSACP